MKKQKQSIKKLLSNVNTINIIFIIVGVLLILFARVPYGFKWGENVLDGIGCSSISAAIMAYFINQFQLAKDNKKEKIFRKLYFKNLYERLGEMLQRMLWFNERMMDDNFNWDFDIKKYGTLKYMLFSYREYKFDEKLSFEELKKRIELFHEKYNLENVKKMKIDEFNKLYKMIKIVLANSCDVYEEKKRLDNDKLMLTGITGLSLKEIDSIIDNINVGFFLHEMNERKAYGAAYLCIFNSFNELRNLCGFDNELTIKLVGTIRADEL